MADGIAVVVLDRDDTALGWTSACPTGRQVIAVAAITARSSVDVGSVNVAFYGKSGAQAYPSTQVAVNRVVTGGHGYTADTAADVWGLSDPETGDANVVSCAVVSWTRRGAT